MVIIKILLLSADVDIDATLLFTPVMLICRCLLRYAVFRHYADEDTLHDMPPHYGAHAIRY